MSGILYHYAACVWRQRGQLHPQRRRPKGIFIAPQKQRRRPQLRELGTQGIGQPQAFLADTLERREAQIAWLEAGMPKIVVYGAHDAALLDLETAAQQRQIPTSVVRDAGRTVVPAGTITCIGIGPAPRESIDVLT